MADERTYTMYHLTPTGWITGSSSDDKPPQGIGPTPDGRVETWLEESISHDSGWRTVRQIWKPLWASTDYSEEERKRLRARFQNHVEKDEQGRVRRWKEFPS
jgi:hypothetical protein